ncbi:MAG: hypothetical protein ABMA15_25700, partial [Vicinamibacterales bacterium]
GGGAAASVASTQDRSSQQRPSGATEAPLEFVCEEDVRLALRDGRKLTVSERAIVTPSARDLAERTDVLFVAPWRG